MHPITKTHNEINEAQEAGDLVLATRLESRLFDLCVSEGMDLDEEDHLEWSAAWSADNEIDWL